MYFPSGEVQYAADHYPARRAHRANPGVGFAWFEGEFELSLLPLDVRLDLARVPAFIELALMDARGFPESLVDERPRRVDYLIHNSDIVRSIMRSPIVVEHSPPSHETLDEIVRRGGAVAVGLYMATQLGPWLPNPLMFIMIPTGIIVAGAAIGVSRGLERGLADRISKAISGNPRRRR